jgi:hypothetical protein
MAAKAPLVCGNLQVGPTLVLVVNEGGFFPKLSVQGLGLASPSIKR